MSGGEIELEQTVNPNDTDPLLHNCSDSDEIKSDNNNNNDDIESASIVTCRICLECDGDEGFFLSF